jgi:hypothetical protein
MEIVRRGEQLYFEKIRSQVEPASIGQFVAIDTNSGDFVVSPSAPLDSRLHHRTLQEGKTHLLCERTSQVVPCHDQIYSEGTLCQYLVERFCK